MTTTNNYTTPHADEKYSTDGEGSKILPSNSSNAVENSSNTVEVQYLKDLEFQASEKCIVVALVGRVVASSSVMLHDE